MPLWKSRATILALVATLAFATTARGEQYAIDANLAADNIEYLTRGPIHEAFAEVVTYDPQPTLVVQKAPPELIEEIPPEVRPEGANVIWIPGYWAWEDERNDFIWVSGIWRAVPRGRQWVPGYWWETETGYQWVAGFWQEGEVVEAAYLPEPPRRLEVRPSAPAPSRTAIWAPGTWMWRESRYAWRPGYWLTARPDRVWAPAHYCWTPRGYLFVDGYWDYVPRERGLLFAPVYFRQPVYRVQAFVYTPYITLDLAAVFDHLFVRPTYRHYYFGDYYDEVYLSRAIYPWFHAATRIDWYYDPLYVYYSRVVETGGPDWEREIRRRYESLRERADLRPARVFDERGQGRGRGRELARTLAEYTRGRGADGKGFKQLQKQEREVARGSGKKIQEYRQERARFEAAKGGSRGKGVAGAAAERERGKPAAGPVERGPGKGTTGAGVERGTVGKGVAGPVDRGKGAAGPGSQAERGKAGKAGPAVQKGGKGQQAVVKERGKGQPATVKERSKGKQVVVKERGKPAAGPRVKTEARGQGGGRKAPPGKQTIQSGSPGNGRGGGGKGKPEVQSGKGGGGGAPKADRGGSGGGGKGKR